MLYQSELSAWMKAVSTALPHLTRAHALGLAVYSYGAMMVQGIGISQVSFFLADVLQQKENTVRQRLREGLYDAAHKRGAQRRDVEVRLCFPLLLEWVLRLWGEQEQVVLALDAITLRQSVTVLVVSVAVGWCAIPVAWTVLSATKKEKWKPHWRALLACLGGHTGERSVWVAADRGLYARWLFEDICACGWHPLLRLNTKGSFVLVETGQRLALATLAQHVRGGFWRGEVVCFRDRQRQLRCTLLALWDHGQQESWILVTDVTPSEVSPGWYSLRMWIEAGFKALKTGALHWERTRMTDPARTERLWLVMTLALLASLSSAPVEEGPMPALRRLSLVKQGMLLRLAAAVRHVSLPAPRLPTFHLPSAPLLEFIPL